VCMDNNRQMKMYSHGYIDNNRKNEAVFPWVYRQ
jgi:hypothetical protein